jgi:hypothetical protein
MSERWRSIWISVGAAALMVTGCGGSSPGQGGIRESCYPNGTCNAGLTCVSQVCVSLDGGQAGDNGGGGAGGKGGTAGSGSGGAAGGGMAGQSGTAGAAGAAGTSGAAGAAGQGGGAGTTSASCPVTEPGPTTCPAGLICSYGSSTCTCEGLWTCLPSS